LAHAARKSATAGVFSQNREARFGQAARRIVMGRDKSVEGFAKALSDAVDAKDASLSRRSSAELTRLHHVRRIPVGARRQPVQIAHRGHPVYAWRERLLDAFDGMARQLAGYEV